MAKFKVKRAASFLAVILSAWLAIPVVAGAQDLPDSVRNAGVTVAEWNIVQQQVQHLSATRDVSQKALAAIAQHLGVDLAARNQVDMHQLLQLIDAQATRLKSFEVALAAAGSGAVSLGLDLGRARAALDAGDLDAAAAILHTARRSTDASLVHAQFQDSIVIGLEAEVEALRFDYVKAASLYGQAAEVISSSDAYGRWDYRTKQAQALYDFGNIFGNARALHEAIHVYKDVALPLVSPNSSQWASTQNAIGLSCVALVQLGDSSGLRQAVIAYRASLAYDVAHSDADNWMRVQNNLANALRHLGEQGDDASMRDATDAYHRLAVVSDHFGNKMMWASAMTGLASARQFQGQHGDIGALRDSVTALRDALKATDRAASPDHWATMQNNLGNTLMDLWDKGDHSAVDAAIAAYQAALEVNTRAHAPLQWANTLANLASAYVAKAEGGASRDNYRAAIDCYRGALTVFTPQDAPDLNRRYANNLAIIEQAFRNAH